jgi:hypothetical protein
MEVLPKKEYYNKLVDYYYEFIHWDEPGPPSIFEWAERDFGAEISRFGSMIHFKNPADASFFKLRWA